MHDFDLAQARLVQTPAQDIGIGLGSHRNQSWMPTPGLLKGKLKVRACGECHNLKARWVRLSHAQRAAADRAGRSQDGDTFHVR
jgi:hypothetical protein